MRSKYYGRPETGDCNLVPCSMYIIFSFALGVQIKTLAFRACVECTHVKKSWNLVVAARGDDLAGQLHMDLAEPFALVTFLIENADEIDHCRAIADTGTQLRRIVNIAFDDLGARQYQHIAAALPAAGKNPDSMATFRQFHA